MEIMDKDLQSIQEVRTLIAKAKEAQAEFKNFSQEAIDKVVENIAKATEAQAVKLAKMAYEDTGYGKWEHKVIKNKFSSIVVYNYIKDLKTVGILKEDKEKKLIDIAVPLGVIAGLIPSTNPTSTAIFKALIALKAGNAIVFSPHPTAVRSITETVKIMQKAAVEAGAPDGLIGCMSILTVEGTAELMKNKDTALILATGGEGMVKAAYSSGTPAIGVGPGNGPCFIERTADIPTAVRKVIGSDTFDNGVICASEQSIIVETVKKAEVIEEFKKQKGYFLNAEESEKIGKTLLRANGTPNPAIVGKDVQALAKLAGISIPSDAVILLSEQTDVSPKNPYAKEKLAPVLAFYTVEDWHEACEKSLALLHNQGSGHTLLIHSQNEEIIREFSLKKPVSRILVNAPGSLGGIGGATNLVPSLTLGCGAVGGSATSDNVGPENLFNIRKVAYGTATVEEIKATFGVSAESSSAPAEPEDNEDVQAIVKAIMAKLNL
ncbi:acetaldehyde dehydrogenase (acetylating) [Clostridium sp.]|jgi:acetaldehyde dehydrogenase (acetylating)|uniref:acetaldehyde dehydrogenase (acetylating) n=1 Tax=Clostridium sp. TaxID=1506 RepID=UPI00359F4273